MIPHFVVRVIAYAIAATVATLALGTVAPQLISFDDATTVLVFGLVLGFADSFVKPVVKVVTLPISCFTLGLFVLVINVVLFFGAASITPGMTINWWGAIVGALLTSVAAGLMFTVVDE